MKIQETRIVMVSLLVLPLCLIFPAHAGQIIMLEKNVTGVVSERKNSNKSEVSVSPPENVPSSNRGTVSRVVAEIKERLEIVETTESKATTATGNAKVYVENNAAFSGAKAIQGTATATANNIVNFGGHFQAAGQYGTGVHGTATHTGDASNNKGGYFYAAGGMGTGVWGTAIGTTSTGVVGVSSGAEGKGVFGAATDSGASTHYGGYFHSEGTNGRGVFGKATGGQGVGVFGTTSGTSGKGVFGESTNTSSGYSNFGGYFKARGSKGIGVFGDASDGQGVYGNAAGTNGRGVVGYGGSWDFYALGSNNYGPFTGGHEVRLSDDFPEELTPGMVVSVTGQTQARKVKDGTVSTSSTLPTIKLSSVPQDRTVFGVFVSESSLPKDHWYKAGQGERFGTVNALGEGRVWVTNQNGEIQAGDYITTSVIPGYGQRQDDDLLHSYTLGKAIETIDWDQVTETVPYEGEMHKAYLIAVVYTSG